MSYWIEAVAFWAVLVAFFLMLPLVMLEPLFFYVNLWKQRRFSRRLIIINAAVAGPISVLGLLPFFVLDFPWWTVFFPASLVVVLTLGTIHGLRQDRDEPS